MKKMEFILYKNLIIISVYETVFIIESKKLSADDDRKRGQ